MALILESARFLLRAICLIHAPARTWSMRKFLSLFFVFGGGGILAADHSGCAVCIAGVVP